VFSIHPTGDLFKLALDWFVATPCPICHRVPPLAATGGQLCEPCRQQLLLPHGGFQGIAPMPWWAAGLYAGSLRSLLLQLRRAPRREALAALIRGVAADLPTGAGRLLLVPIPSWKRHANPLPPLLCRELARQRGQRVANLLERSHPVLGQHHLGREMRHANQAGAFRCNRRPLPGEPVGHQLLIVDDILTTGATACSAAGTLEEAGWPVAGLLCLARTPKGQPRAARAVI
jgi:predicted amidophosphoribosyltransferase